MKSKGLIAEIIREYTFFPSGKYRHYLSIAELCNLLQLIVKTNQTVEYMQAIPFYKTISEQYEFENHMLFVKKLKENENVEEFRQSSIVDEYGNPCEGVIRFFSGSDLDSFQKALLDYQAYMNILTHEVYDHLNQKCNIQNEKLLLGQICFEIHAE